MFFETSLEQSGTKKPIFIPNPQVETQKKESTKGMGKRDR